jgi:hypothetical protein
VDLEDIWGRGTFYCDGRFPQSIMKLRRGYTKPDGTKIRGVNAVAYTTKREDGLRELNSRFAVASDGLPRQFVSKRCANFISEALEYRENVKERDHAVDAGRYSLPIRAASQVSAKRAKI